MIPNNKPVADAELLRSMDIVRLSKSYMDAQKVYGIPASTLRLHIAEAARRWPYLVKVVPGKRPEFLESAAASVSSIFSGAEYIDLSPSATPPVEEPEFDVATLRDKQKADATASQLKRAQERIVELEDALANVVQIKNTKLDPVAWRPAVHTGKSELLPMLFTSDFQCGEVIVPDEIDGINAYNKDIFAQRYATLIEKTIDLSFNYTGLSSFPGVFYLRGGDALSGGIHLELQDTDDLASVPAVRWLVQHESEGIKRLRDKFGRVHVISIPGNHGRNTFKPRAKGYVDHSYETLIAWWLQDRFEGDPNVTFSTPKSGDAYFKAAGWNFLLSHGDRMGSRGGQGFIGPAATIARGHAKLQSNWSLTGRPADIILTGHLHTSLRLQSGFANGSLAGYGEYARDLRASPDAAKQWLLFAHERYRVSQAFEVQLSDSPRRDVEDFSFERAA